MGWRNKSMLIFPVQCRFYKYDITRFIILLWNCFNGIDISRNGHCFNMGLDCLEISEVIDKKNTIRGSRLYGKRYKKRIKNCRRKQCGTLQPLLYSPCVCIIDLFFLLCIAIKIHKIQRTFLERKSRYRRKKWVITGMCVFV